MKSFLRDNIAFPNQSTIEESISCTISSCSRTAGFRRNRLEVPRKIRVIL